MTICQLIAERENKLIWRKSHLILSFEIDIK